MLALAGKMPDFEYDRTRGRFRGLLQTIAQRAIAKKLRQVYADQAKTDLDASSEPTIEAPDWEQAWRQHHIKRALTRIESESRERDRLAFARYAIEGRDAEGTAKEFSLTLEQLYQIKSRMLSKLAQHIEAQIRAEDEHD